MQLSRARSAGLAVAVLALVASGATAVAASRGSDAKVAACANVRTGALRLETPKAPCVGKGPARKRERRVVWGATGAVGPAGRAGPSGAPGPTGPAGAAGTDRGAGLPGADRGAGAPRVRPRGVVAARRGPARCDARSGIDLASCGGRRGLRLDLGRAGLAASGGVLTAARWRTPGRRVHVVGVRHRAWEPTPDGRWHVTGRVRPGGSARAAARRRDAVRRGSVVGVPRDSEPTGSVPARARVVVDHRALVERQVAGEHLVEPLAVEAVGPVADQHRGDRVAGEVGERAGLGHEPVDADDQADAVDQLGAVRLQAAGQGGEAGAGDAGGALGGDRS